MQQQNQLIFADIIGKGGNVGLITLNRPKTLNALTEQMCIDLYNQLVIWEEDPQIKAVIIHGNGERAFCAGGDIRYFYEMRHATTRLPQFFQHEYRLDHYIFHYSKPYISLLHGITMGGGAGISINGSHRVAAENLIFAMPETAIGFHPDIGAGYFLTRCLNNIGFYFGLTGTKIDVNTAFYYGLIDAVVSQKNFSKLIDAIVETKFSNDVNASVSNIIQQFSLPASLPAFIDRQNILEQCFSKNSMEEIIAALQNQQHPWTEKIVNDLLTKSPTSLKVTLKKLQESKHLNFDDCIRMDYRLTLHFLQNQDFYEGIRAAVIDKDRNPKWQPATLNEVNAKDIDKYFSPIREELNFS